jgi:hypothetical protein
LLVIKFGGLVLRLRNLDDRVILWLARQWWSIKIT